MFNFNDAKALAEGFWRAHGSTVLLTGGIGLMAGSAVLACVRSAKTVPETVAAEAEDMAEARETEDKAVIAKQAIVSVAKIARHYTVPVAIFSVGAACTVMAKQLEHRKAVVVGAAYNSLLAAFNEYRAKVVEHEGEEADRRYLHGEREVEVIEEKTGKDGKKRERKKTVTAIGSGDSNTLYHRFWGRSTSTQWVNDPVYNLSFLKAQEAIANNNLHARGYVLLSEVYQQLGFELEGHSNAAMVGWILGGGDDYVDFGIYSPAHDHVEDSVNKNSLAVAAGIEEPDRSNFSNAEFEGSFYLDFNCDGIIIDRI